MSFNDDLFDVLNDLRSSNVVPVASPADCSKRASVAIIIAFFPVNATPSSQATTLTDFSELGRHVRRDPGLVPHILFIRRATRQGDRWSSHIALPGGKKEIDETDFDAAVRESMEEVSLDLAASAIPCGSLRSRVVTCRLGTQTLLVLSPYVFLWTSVGAVPVTRGQESEVSACHWVPLQSLLSRENVTVESVDVSHRLGMPRFMSRGIGVMTFTGITLRPSISIYSPPLAASDNHDNGIVQRTGESRRRVLWGLTHAVLLDFLTPFPRSNLRRDWSFPTFSAPDVKVILWLLNTPNRLAVRRYTGPDYVGNALVNFYKVIRPTFAITFGVRLLTLLFALRYLHRRLRGT